MIRFYSYLIYRLYKWRLDKKDNTPVTTVELLMLIPHFFQLMTAYAILTFCFPGLRINIHPSTLIIAGIALASTFLYHFIVYDKKKWEKYFDEFKNESQTQKNRRTTFIYLYFIGSHVFFFVTMFILFT
jgi:flagellar biosynthesis protein FliP